MNTALPLSFAPMAVHIGEEIERRRKAMRMSKTELAKEIGVDRSHIYDLITQPSIDTGKLRLCSKALQFNFFTLLSSDLDVELGTTTTLADPATVYSRRPAEQRPPLRLVIEVDPSDDQAQRVALRMAETMHQANKGPSEKE